MNAVIVPESGAEIIPSRLSGSSDALVLARLAGEARPVAVLCAQAADAQRLCEEIGWFAPSLKVVLFPDWETLPYDAFSPHQDLISERLATLYHLQRREFDVVIVPAATALYRLPPPAYLAAYTFFLSQGGTLKLDELRAQLTLAGYHHVTQVVAPGEYCVRGGLIDLFPMGSALPYRIDLEDDVIESIRTFDVDTQRTIYKVTEVRLLPAREFPMDDAGRNGFRARFRDAFEGDPSKSTVYRDVSNGVAPAGIEYYLPLFFEATATLFDYLPAEAKLCLHRDVHAALTDFWRDTQSRFQFLRGDRTRPLLAPGELFLTAEELFIAARAFVRADIRTGHEDLVQGGISALPVPEVAVERRAADPLHRLKAFVSKGIARVLLVAETPGRRETLTQYLGEYGLRPDPCGSFAEFLASSSSLGLAVGPVLNGFVLDRESLAIVTESELYVGTARVHGRGDRSRQTSVEGMLRDLSELRVGDPVVHAQHGIGRYRGLVNLDPGADPKTQVQEFLLIEYAEADKLYVPVAQLHLIGRYSGGPPEAAPLHKLGADTWDKAKRRAARAVRDTAAELLHLYALRASRHGRPFGVSQHDVDAFAESFGFEETQDQAAAIVSANGFALDSASSSCTFGWLERNG